MDIMLDLETLSTRTDAVVLSIGAVSFTPDGLKESFYKVLNSTDQAAAGRHVDDGTVAWWAKQSDEARKVLTESADQREDVEYALGEFCEWVLNQGTLNTIRMWGCGSDFDNVIMADLLRTNDVAQPWRFWNNRCFRTWRDMATRQLGSVEAKSCKPANLCAHNALADAEAQAREMIALFNALERRHA